MHDDHKANFEKWFGDSKVVDAAGAPRVLYHSGSFDTGVDAVPRVGELGFHLGTEQAARERVVGKLIEDRAAEVDLHEEEGRFYLDDEWSSAPSEGFRSAEDARSWLAGEIGRWDLDFEDSPLTAAYVSIKNPKRLQDQDNNWAPAIAAAKLEGHDGIVYRNAHEDKGSDSFIIFRPEQIKCAIGNSGLYALDNPDITDRRAAAQNALDYLANALQQKRAVPHA